MMADLEMELEETAVNGGSSQTHSRESSDCSEWWHGEEGQNKENAHSDTVSGQDSESSEDSKEGGKLILCDGGQLAEESGTELTGHHNPGFKSGSAKNGDSVDGGSSFRFPEIPPRQPSSWGSGAGTARQRALKSGNIVSSIPEEEITIPNDGNLASFSADAMATFLRYLRLESRLINHLHRNGLDGRKFGRLKDSDLDKLELNNPVVVYFRDRTASALTKKAKHRLPFVL